MHILGMSDTVSTTYTFSGHLRQLAARLSLRLFTASTNPLHFFRFSSNGKELYVVGVAYVKINDFNV